MGRRSCATHSMPENWRDASTNRSWLFGRRSRRLGNRVVAPLNWPPLDSLR
jgi:hypothetical protein